MTGNKDDYEARRKREAEAAERQEVAYQSRMKREALADEVALLAIESVKAFLEGRAYLEVIHQGIGALAPKQIRFRNLPNA